MNPKRFLMGNVDLQRNVDGFLSAFDKRHLYPPFRVIESGANEPECIVGGKKYLLFCANNYLALSQNKAVKEAAKKAIDQYGIGPGGSPVISGYLSVTQELEQCIARFTEKEDCVTFPTGYMANVAIFRSLMDPLFGNMPVSSEDSVIFSDEFNHGSIVDGCKLSKARKVIFKHNDIDDLRRKIDENALPNKLIVTEGVFSLEGEITPLPDFIRVAKEKKAKLMVDDAHGVGILGEKGGGTGQHFSCTDGIDVLMGCMDKALGGTGGYLCGSKNLIKYLRIAARSSILSSAIPASTSGAMIEAINQIERGSDLRKELFEKAKYARDAFINAGFIIVGDDVLPAIPLLVGKEVTGIRFADRLWEEGIYSPIIRWPAVPQDQSRFRITIMVNHTKAQIDDFVEKSKSIGKELRII